MQTDKIQQAIKSRFELFRAENHREISRVLYELKKNGFALKENQLYKLLANGRYQKLITDHYFNPASDEYTALITDRERKLKIRFTCKLAEKNRIEIKDRQTGDLKFEAEFMWYRYFYIYYHLCLN